MSDTDRGRSTRRRIKRRSPSATATNANATTNATTPTTNAPRPPPQNEGLKNLFVTMLYDKFRVDVIGQTQLSDPKSMELVVRPIVKYVTGEPPVIITCLLQYSSASLFHSIYRFITGQVEQLHFQFTDVMTLLNDNKLYRLMNEEPIAFRTECMRAFMEAIVPADQVLAVNVEIVILRQDSIQLVILHAVHGAANNIAVKIHGDGKFLTCSQLLAHLSIMQFLCCRFLNEMGILIEACLRQHRIAPFMPASGMERLIDPKKLPRYVASIRRKATRTYWTLFMSGIRKENNFGVVPYDDDAEAEHEACNASIP